jgi:6-pyruvoyltetrahydropterin/6-carboxytetrahydropterin synthase
MVRLTRRYRFSASHRLHARGLSEAENRALYGKCNNPHGHGHDYSLEVGVSGAVDPVTGCVVDLGALDALVSGEVLGTFDHRNLNEELPEFADSVPTTENLAAAIERRLARRWAEAFPDGWPRLERIGLRETARNSVELLRTPFDPGDSERTG